MIKIYNIQQVKVYPHNTINRSIYILRGHGSQIIKFVVKNPSKIMKNILENCSLETNRVEKIQNYLKRISNFKKCLKARGGQIWAPPSWDEEFEQDGGVQSRPHRTFKHFLYYLVFSNHIQMFEFDLFRVNNFLTYFWYF